MDRSLTGTWKARENGGEEPLVMHIYPFNDHEVIIVTEKEPGILRAFTTIIAGRAFLNIQDITASSPSQRKWSYAGYTLDNTVLTLRIVGDRLFKERVFQSAEELYGAVERNLGNPDLFEDRESPIVFDRVKK